MMTVAEIGRLLDLQDDGVRLNFEERSKIDEIVSEARYRTAKEDQVELSNLRHKIEAIRKLIGNARYTELSRSFLDELDAVLLVGA